MHIQRILPSIGPPIQLQAPVIVFGDTWEKNWCPIDSIVNRNTGSTDFLFARFVEPHQILQCNESGFCFEAASTSRKQYFQDLLSRHQLEAVHLGTNAVRISQKYYGAIFHVMRHGRLAERKYVLVPYVFEAKWPWSIVRVARTPLTLPTPTDDPNLQLTFASGLSFLDGRLIVSYGYMDKEPMFYSTTVERLFRGLERVA